MPKHIEGLSAKAWPAPSHTRGKHAGASQPAHHKDSSACPRYTGAQHRKHKGVVFHKTCCVNLACHHMGRYWRPAHDEARGGSERPPTSLCGAVRTSTDSLSWTSSEVYPLHIVTQVSHLPGQEAQTLALVPHVLKNDVQLVGGDDSSSAAADSSSARCGYENKKRKHDTTGVRLGLECTCVCASESA